LKNEPLIGRKPIKEDIIFIIEFCRKISTKSAEGRKKGILCSLFNFVEKSAQNRPKADKREFYVLYSNLKKRAQNWPKADKREFYVSYSNLLKNEPKIGRRPIKGEFMFII
jgi:hypothetical protein